ncbi:MAG TPA: TIGR02300 family protein [Alphaproteobacteria bacterium]|nr:TIGR02300 family protein [Alphaproteobacteria bacterium]
MVNPEWGIKRTCHSCGAKYYDFKKKTPACPNCGTPFNPEALLKSRRRAMPEEKAPKPAPVVEEVEVETEEAEGDAAVVPEDTEDLGGDDTEVVETAEEEEG